MKPDMLAGRLTAQPGSPLPDSKGGVFSLYSFIILSILCPVPDQSPGIFRRQSINIIKSSVLISFIINSTAWLAAEEV